MLWIKALHVIFMVTWFAGIFYLPRLFVYHAMAIDSISIARFKVMEQKLYIGIATPGALLTTFFGVWLLIADWQRYAHLRWMHWKLLLVILLWLYHLYCGRVWLNFKRGNNKRGHVYYRWVNEIPTVLLVGIIVLVIVQP